MTRKVTYDELKTLLAGSKPVLVDFSAPWCQPCQAMAPVVEALAGELTEQVEVVLVDLDEEMDAAVAFRVRGVPTFIAMRGGLEVGRRTGAMPGAALKQWVSSSLG